MKILLTILAGLAFLATSAAFVPSTPFRATSIELANVKVSPVVVFMSDDFLEEGSSAITEKIEALVEKHPVLLFMKGSKLFPQCGFSNTATQILNSYGIDFHTIDVLADQDIRQGIKEFSQWPTIPQLYVCGEFVGGSDIMIEMYQSGELGEMIEKAKAEMI